MVIYCIELHMVRYGHIMYRSAYGTKRLWYEMTMVRNGYGTKMFFTMVQNGRYEMVMVRNDCNSMRPLVRRSLSWISRLSMSSYLLACKHENHVTPIINQVMMVTVKPFERLVLYYHT